MRTQTQQAGYDEALNALLGLGQVVPNACFNATLGGRNGIWEVRLLGYRSSRTEALRVLLGMDPHPFSIDRNEDRIIRTFRSYRGRTAFELTDYEKVIRRMPEMDVELLGLEHALDGP